MPAVEFFFDASCPWTWVTSRWLATVAPRRDLDITWRTWSLSIKHSGHSLPDTLPAEAKARMLAEHEFSASAMRVIEAARAGHGQEVVGPLYTELGRRFHRSDDVVRARDQRGVMAAALSACDLPGDLAAAADDPSWDEIIRANMAQIEELIGDDVGVPIVALVRPEGDGDERGCLARLAMAGPILARVPPPDQSLTLWDAVSTLIGHEGLYELKRHRAGGGPDQPQIDPEGRAVG